MKLRLLSITLLAAIQLSAQPAGKNTPVHTSAHTKLIVGIVVDQMRPDYLSRYMSKFQEGGFKRLLNEGYSFEDAAFNYMPTYTGPGHACIYTGTTPSANGIIANDWYSREEHDTVYCAEDHSVKTIGADGNAGQMSPHRLLTTTISDEIKLFNKDAKVIGISLKDRGAILPAGRNADAAYWFESKTGNWISSSWYMNELPAWVKLFNDRKLPEQYLSKPWETLINITLYTESTADDSPYEAAYKGEEKPVFPHNFPAIKTSGYELVRRSPFGNTLTEEFAKAAIVNENLGKDSVTDLLAISFSATDYVGHQFGTRAIETEDTYLRLDRDLADLLLTLDKQVGKGNYVLFLTADHGAVDNPQYLIDHRLPGGFLNSKMMEDSIRNFLQSKYQQAALYMYADNDQIYLNDSILINAKLNRCDVAKQLADYLIQLFPEVADVVTACQLCNENYNQSYRSFIQHGFMPSRSGDICMFFRPGFTGKLYGARGNQGTTHGTPYAYDTHVPLIFFGQGIKSGSSSKSVKITDIAPTLSVLTGCAFPSGCTGKPLSVSKK